MVHSDCLVVVNCCWGVLAKIPCATALCSCIVVAATSIKATAAVATADASRGVLQHLTPVCALPEDVFRLKLRHVHRSRDPRGWRSRLVLGSSLHWHNLCLEGHLGKWGRTATMKPAACDATVRFGLGRSPKTCIAQTAAGSQRSEGMTIIRQSPAKNSGYSRHAGGFRATAYSEARRLHVQFGRREKHTRLHARNVTL